MDFAEVGRVLGEESRKEAEENREISLKIGSMGVINPTVKGTQMRICHRCKHSTAALCVCTNFCGSPMCQSENGIPVVKVDKGKEDNTIGEDWINALLNGISPIDAAMIRALLASGMGMHGFSFDMNYLEITLSNEASVWVIRLEPNIRLVK